MKNTKKFAALMALILAFTMLAAACGNSSDTRKTKSRDRDDDEEEEVEETEEPETTEEPTDPGVTEEPEPTETEDPAVTDEPVSELQMYGYILDDVLYYTSGNVLEDDIFDLTGLGELALYSGFDDLQNYVGYVLKDVNGDGISELMIVYKPTDEPDGYNIVALYTMTEDQYPWLAAEGWTRNNVYLLDDNTFMSIGSGGAAYTYISLFRLDEDNNIEYTDNFYTDYEDPDDYTSALCWFVIIDGEAYNLGRTDKYTPDIGSSGIHDISGEFVPICENEHYYQVVIGDFTYEEAVAKCEEMGGHLATIDSEREAYTIASFLGYNTEFAQVFVGEPTITGGGFKDNGGSGDCFMASISGEDGSLLVTKTSSDPLADDPSASGFIGFICETEYK